MVEDVLDRAAHDVVILHDTTVAREARELTTLLANESFAVAEVDASEADLDLVDEALEGGARAIVVMSSSSSPLGLAKSMMVRARAKTDLVLGLVKGDHVTPAEGVEQVAFSNVAQNDGLKRAVNALLDRADLAGRHYTAVGRDADYARTLQVYNDREFAAAYFERWKDHLPEDRLEHFGRLLRPSARVLDAGCGPGHHAVFLSRLGFDLVGVDLSAAALEHARRVGRGTVRFIRADMLQTGLDSASFDGIWCCAAATHVPRDRLSELLAELRRLLAPEGVLALTLSIGERQHHDIFDRFFESFPNRRFVFDLLSRSSLPVLEVQDDIAWSSTQGDLRAVNWMTFYARPDEGSR